MFDPIRSRFSRWSLVAIAAAAMGVVGTYQFVWSSLRVAIADQLGTPETALGTVFTVFLIGQTISGVPAGWVRDRYGPQVPMLVGTVCVTGGYLGTSVATTVPAVVLAYGVGGVGAGVVYNVAVNTPVKWFRDRQAFATGVVTMAYSGVSVAFIPIVRSRVASAYAPTLTAMAVVVGVTCLFAVVVLHDPHGADTGDSTTVAGDRDRVAFDWRATVGTWQFWVLYAVMIVVNGVGLMLIGKAVSFATGLGLPAAVGTAAASVIAISEAGGIAVVSAVSDRVGAERTIAAALVGSGVAVAAAVLAGGAGVGAVFVVAVGAAAFLRSPVFAVFPGLVADYFGRRRSSQNYALLYTAKIPGSVIGGVGASFVIDELAWSTTFLGGATLLVLAGGLTAVLHPVNRASSPA